MEFIIGLIVLIIILYLLNLIFNEYFSKSKEGSKIIFYKTLIQAAVISIVYGVFLVLPFK